MFDKYFCSRLHTKKITLDMVMDYFFEHPTYKKFIRIATIIGMFGAIFAFMEGDLISVLCIGVIIGVLLALFELFIAPKIQVASCPLTKTGGNNNV